MWSCPASAQPDPAAEAAPSESDDPSDPDPSTTEDETPASGDDTAAPDAPPRQSSIFVQLAEDPYTRRYGVPPEHGWIRVFDTPVEVRFGGFIQLNIIHDFQDAGYDYGQFIPALIAAPTDTRPNTEFDLRPSRLTFETRTDVDRFGSVSTLVSLDWFGGSSASPVLPRLRQAYVTWVGPKSHVAFTVGQAWTTFMDLQAWPAIADLQGPNAMTGVRQGLVRGSYSFDRGSNVLVLDVSIEQPETGVQNGIGLRRWPDLALRLSARGDWGHVALALLARELTGESLAGTGRDSAFGNGVSLSGSIDLPATRRAVEANAQEPRQDSFTYQVQGGHGTGRYVFDLGSGTAPQDAFYSDARGELLPLWQIGGFLSFEHWWMEGLRSTVVGSFEQVFVLEGQADDVYHRAVYAVGNLVYRVFDRMDMGAEYEFGRLWLKDGTSGYAHRLIVGANYGF